MIIRLDKFLLMVTVVLLGASLISLLFAAKKLASNLANYAYFFILLETFKQIWDFFKSGSHNKQ